MINKKNIRKIFTVGGIGALLLGSVTLTGCGADVQMSQEDFDAQIADAEANAAILAKAEGITEGVDSVDITSDNALAVTDFLNEKNLTAEDLMVLEDAKAAQEEVDATDAVEPVVPEVSFGASYTIDELEIGATFSDAFSDRQIDLFDGEIEFDGDDYDAEEIVELNGVTVAANEEDGYNADTYLQVSDGGVSYTLSFAKEFNSSEVSEGETLSFSFLGNGVEVSEWTGDEITFTQGDSHFLNEGSSVTVGDKEVVVLVTGEDYIYVEVAGEGEFNVESDKIYEGDVQEVNGVEIKLDSVFETTSWRAGGATIEVGGDVEKTVESGDEYSEDSVWTWSIDGNSIGVVLSEDFTSIDEDEDYNALAVGDELCLPNEYVCVSYEGLVEEDSESFEFEAYEKDGSTYARGVGTFLNGITDYSKVYINGTGFYDSDLELINAVEMGLGDSELKVVLNGANLIVDDIEFSWNTMRIAGVDVCSEEEDYLTSYGIVVKNPEDGCEDQEFDMEVPDEEVTASVVISK